MAIAAAADVGTVPVPTTISSTELSSLSESSEFSSIASMFPSIFDSELID